MAKKDLEASEFSLVLGGPFYQFCLRAHMVRPALDLLKRRIMVLTLFAWLPLAILALFEGRFFGGANIPFLLDIGTHVRFLICIPLLIAAELTIHQRMRPLVMEFLNREIVLPSDRSKFQSIIASVLRLRDSYFVELILIAVVLLWGQHPLRSHGLLENTWYNTGAAGTKQLTFAGFWYAYVSIPLLQFLACRWYFRLGLWCWFLFRTARLPLHLIPTHPDRVGGLGFLEDSVYAFFTLVLAHSAALSASIASHIFFQGATLAQFKVEIATFVLILLSIILGPLLSFTPRLLRTRRLGIREYGKIASQMVKSFDERWLRKPAKGAEGLLDVADVQSLADLGGSFDVVRNMKPFPFGKDALIQVFIALALPLLPLVLTVIPAEELLSRVLKILL